MSALAESGTSPWRVGPGTLYRVLSEMTKTGLVERFEQGGASRGPARRYYRLSARGRRVLAAETTRMAAIVARARTLGVVTPR
jgi:PadR family transcriptional regulator PadR